MQHEWRLLVTSPDGDPKPTISIDDAVASLDAFDVDGMGNSLEATITAKPSAVDLGLRDVVTLEARGPVGSWVPYYRGIVTIAGNPRSSGLQQYRLVGLKRRFYEVTCPLSFVPGGDAAAMARAILDALTLPIGASFDASDAPDVGFELGDRFPALESVGDALDALAVTVGAFVVPVGESYEYDGAVFGEGALVPAVRWGVTADGRVFWRRAVEASSHVTEGAPGVRVEWSEAQAEEVADCVRLVYAAGTNLDTLTRADRLPDDFNAEAIPLAPVFRPLSRVFSIEQGDIDEVLGLRGTEALNANAEKVVTLDNPGDLMTRVENIAWLASTNESLWADLENAFDGDPGTYATNSVVASVGQFFVGDELAQGGPFTTGEAILHLEFRVFDQGSSVWPLYAKVWSLWLNATVPDSQVAVLWEFGGNENDDDRYVSLIVPLLVPAQTADGYPPTRLNVYAILPANTRLYRFGVLVPDGDVGGVGSKRVATTLAQLPTTAASLITLPGLHPPSTWVALTTRDDDLVEAPVERVEYRITRDAGAITAVHVGQAFDAELEQQRVILERLARRATREGGAAR